jgi:hypothetical protein
MLNPKSKDVFVGSRNLPQLHKSKARLGMSESVQSRRFRHVRAMSVPRP